MKFAVILTLVITVTVVSINGKRLYNALPESGYSKQQRADQEWYKYRAEQQCRVINTRTHTEYHHVYLLNHSETIREYEWTCRGGDTHWTR